MKSIKNGGLSRNITNQLNVIPSLAKSPTKISKTQSNHIMCSMLAFIKLEYLKIKTDMNHFALKNKLFINATRAAFVQLRKFRLMHNQTNIQSC